MKRPDSIPAFMPAHSMSPLRTLPAGPTLLILFTAQILTLYSGPALFLALSFALLLTCALGRRPVHRVLFRAWPVLILAAITAWRRADVLSWEAVLVFFRFCWLIVAADLYVSSFAWQPMLARTATTTVDAALGKKSSRRPPLGRRGVRAVALTVWLTILQLPTVVQTLQTRRLAALARGIPLYRMMTPQALSSLLSTLVRRADTRAEALQARGLE